MRHVLLSNSGRKASIPCYEEFGMQKVKDRFILRILEKSLVMNQI
jgi:hypothetical protein